MITFRYHLLSIVAVFLALAIGVVMGYGVLSQPTVEGLQSRIDAVERNANAERVENRRLEAENEQLRAAGDAMSTFAATDRLSGVPVVVLAVRDVSETAVDRVVQLAQTAGATAPGILWLEPRWGLEDRADVTALAEAVGSTGTARGVVRDEAWETLMERLAAGPSPTGDALRRLASAEFVTFAPVGEDTAGLDDLGGPRTVVIVADGASLATAPRNPIVPITRFAELASLPLVVAEELAEDGSERGTRVAVVRDDSDLAATVSTVDNLERVEGQIAAVLAAADLGRNVVGHYGVGPGADALLPTWWQP